MKTVGLSDRIYIRVFPDPDPFLLFFGCRSDYPWRPVLDPDSDPITQDDQF